MVERYYKHIYCETQFLEMVISRMQNEEFSQEKNEELQFWTCFMTLIFSPNVSLVLDIGKEQFLQNIKGIDRKRLNAAKKGKEADLSSYEKFLVKIITEQQTGNVSLECLGCDLLSQIDSYEEDWKMNAYYFTCKDKATCNQIISDYGVLIICPDTFTEFISIIYDEGVAIKNKERGRWDNILKTVPFSCNSLAIIDNYILNNTQQMIENLSQVFNVLLPEKLNSRIPFQITIISALRQNKNIDLPSKIRWDKLKDMIDQLRPELNYTLAIYKCSSDLFHDRSIITNNLFIGSGAGFDLFNKQTAQKTTTINIVCPYLTNTVKWANQAYTNLITEIRAIYPSISRFINDSFPSFYIGDKENRLFEID